MAYQNKKGSLEITQKNRGLFLYVAPTDVSYQVEDISAYALQLRPKLGLLYLASVLKSRKGMQCEIWDQTASPYRIEDVVKAVDSGDYLFVGLYCAVSMETNVVEFIKGIRRNAKMNIPIIVGGPSFFNAGMFMKAGCDMVCNGEGEETVCDIVEFIKGSKNIEDVKGISYMRDGEIRQNAIRPAIEDMDSIPFPDYSLIDLNKYHDFYIFTMRVPYSTMIASRGCPFSCAFCDSHMIWGKRYRTRSVANVLAEIEELVERYGVRYIAFQDDVFGMDHEWTDEFCGKLKDRRYDLRWMCILHPFSFKKDPEKMLRRLRASGCDLISLGLQSAHPEILRRIDRSPDEPGSVKRLIGISRRLGMLSLVSFIFGSPGETYQTIQESINFAFEVKPNYAKFYSMVTLPGSKLARDYGTDSRLCDFTKAQLDEFCSRATSRFYLNAGNLSRNIYFIMRNNPAWFKVGFRHMTKLMGSVGVGNKR